MPSPPLRNLPSLQLSCIKQGRHGNMFLLQSREPTYTKGNYRLNFHGRVTVPSVKNFQLVSPDDKLHTVCQFGKVITACDIPVVFLARFPGTKGSCSYVLSGVPALFPNIGQVRRLCEQSMMKPSLFSVDHQFATGGRRSVPLGLPRPHQRLPSLLYLACPV